MTTLRFPLAGIWGAVFAVALFALLAHLVNVPMDVAQSVKPRIFDFTTVRSATPVEIKRPPKPTRTLPPVAPGTPRIGIPTETFGTSTAFIPPPVTIIEEGGLFRRMGSDRDVNPLVRVVADYPPRALRDRIEGWVKVQFTITAAGTVKDAFVVASDPRNVFEEAALRAIARWRYNPRVEGGMAVERVGMQTMIRFELENTL